MTSLTPERVAQLMTSKIGRIRIIRDLTSCSINDAKKAVEDANALEVSRVELAPADLTAVYGEVPRFAGRVPAGKVETWLNEDTGTWSITITYPGGAVCLIASGDLFRVVSKPGELV